MLQVSRDRSGRTAVNLHTQAGMPGPEPAALARLWQEQPLTAQHIGLIFETEGRAAVGRKVGPLFLLFSSNNVVMLLPTVGRQVVLDLSRHRAVLPVLRVNIQAAEARAWRVTTAPTLVIIDR